MLQTTFNNPYFAGLLQNIQNVMFGEIMVTFAVMKLLLPLHYTYNAT
jgi:hypothetical protein